MENTPWFGNDDDEVDMIARRCGQIYSYEVEKYKNPRGGQFQAAAILYQPMYYLERT